VHYPSSNKMSHQGKDAFLCEVCGSGFGSKEKLKALCKWPSKGKGLLLY
jgi:peptide methionine sulfoxide reductase MsrB